MKDERKDEWECGDSFTGTCDHRGRINVPVTSSPDPFIAEVYPEDRNEPSLWCLPCFSRRKDDI